MKTQPIGYLDSGVGGLTVVKEALNQLPNEQVIYIGDQARLPYGPRPQTQVRAFTWQMVNFLLRQNIKMLVVACNTATAAALPDLRAKLKIPVVGVIVPGSRAAIKATTSRHIGVIATAGTVNSGTYANTIHQKDPAMTVTSLAAPKFVSLVESNEMRSPVAKKVIAETLTPLQHQGIDTLVLGCTHYPLLRPLIQNVMGPSVTLIDSGAEAVSEVSMLLDYFNLANHVPTKPSHQFYTTGSAERFNQIASQWLGLNVAATHICIEKEPTDMATPQTIVIASKNPGKIKEFQAMFHPAGLTVKSLADFPEVPAIAETGTTFEENARLKATGYAKALNLPVIADDSGLMVDALGGQPGVFSARYAGPGHNDAANNAKLMAELAATPKDKRTATFHSTLVFAKPNQEATALVVTGEVAGMITGVPRGDNGFGYDPYFLLPELDKTMAQLSAEEKNQISHRGNAMRALEAQWAAWFKEENA